MRTIRLTIAQALVKFLSAQHTEGDGQRVGGLSDFRPWLIRAA